MDKWVIDEESKTEVFNTIKGDSTLVKKWVSFELWGQIFILDFALSLW